MKVVLAFFIRLYQKTVSPDHGFLRVFYPNGYCRFYPTCSEYARIAILEHGTFRGGYLAIRRLLKCHPFHPPGIDPVPNNTHKNQA